MKKFQELEQVWLETRKFLKETVNHSSMIDTEFHDKVWTAINLADEYIREQKKTAILEEVKIAKGQSTAEYATALINAYDESYPYGREEIEKIVDLIKQRTVQNVMDFYRGQEACGKVVEFLTSKGNT